jgi:CBS domain-containing protein
MDPIATGCGCLRAEHELIGQVLAAIEMLTARTRSSGTFPVPVSPIAGAIDFFGSFVEGCHEAKEEEGLFPALARHGEPPDLSLGSFSVEHDEGRRLAEALRPLSGRARIDGQAIGLVETYAAFLRGHMALESTTLFPWAASVLTPADETWLARRFDEVERRAVGPGGREVVLALADAVTLACRNLGGPPARPGPLLARNVMRAEPRTVAPGDTLARVDEIMTSVGVHELPVVRGDRLVGILARADMEPRRGHFEWTTVGETMTPDPVSVDADTPVATVARILLAHSFNGVPVVEGTRVVGMIARSDLLRILAGDGPSGGP